MGDLAPSDAALKCLDDWMAAFNAQNLDAWKATFNFPSVQLARDGRIRLIRSADAAPNPFERLTKGAWHHSAWGRRVIIHAGAEKVHIDTQYIRYRADNSVIRCVDSLYIVTLQDGHWGVKGRSNYA